MIADDLFGLRGPAGKSVSVRKQKGSFVIDVTRKEEMAQFVFDRPVDSGPTRSIPSRRPILRAGDDDESHRIPKAEKVPLDAADWHRRDKRVPIPGGNDPIREGRSDLSTRTG